MNMGLALTLRSSCLWFFPELLLDTLYPRKANYWIPKDIGHYQHVNTKNPQGYPNLQWHGAILSMFHT